MNPENSTSNDGADFTLPVPDQPADQPISSDPNPAAEMIRRKVQEAYRDEPDAATEVLDAAELSAGQTSRHQKFILELTASGKSLAEIQDAWHEYYAGLTDLEKHHVWNEFYTTHAKASKLGSAAPEMDPAKPQTLPQDRSIPRATTTPKPGLVNRSMASLSEYVLGLSKPVAKADRPREKEGLKSLLFGLTVGCAAVLILLGGFFNERFVAPFIQPSRAVTNTPIISQTGAIGSDPEIIIPKINVEIPVVYGMTSVAENDVNSALERGVLHYADTALPGEDGNAVIVGHSSNNIFNKGSYKFAFVLLNRLENGDTVYLERDGKRYTYQVYESRVVKPTDVSVLGPKDRKATVTLITCDPPGTSTNRLVVVAEQISPDPITNIARTNSSSKASSAAVIPSNAPSLWSRIVGLLPL